MVLFHAVTLAHVLMPHVDELPIDLTVLSYGVHLFFMISGFVIFHTTRRSRGVLDFAIARFTRLYPTFWVCLAITAMVGTVSGAAWLTPTPVQLLGNASMVPAVFGIKLLDGAYWTLFVEMVFYGGMAVLLGAGLLRREKVATTLVVSVAVIGALVCLTTSLMGLTGRLSDVIITVFIFEYLGLFATGMVALTMRELRAMDWRLLLSVGSALTAAWAMHGTRHALVLAVVIAIFLLVALSPSVPILRAGPLQFLGAVSYSWYLLHQNISYAIIGALPDQRVLATLLALATTLLLAWAVERVVERRFSPWLRRKMRARFVR